MKIHDVASNVVYDDNDAFVWSLYLVALLFG
jgi:hypothetical protein